MSLLLEEINEILQLDEKVDVDLMMSDITDKDRLIRFLVDAVGADYDVPREFKEHAANTLFEKDGFRINDAIELANRIRNVWKRDDRVAFGIRFVKLSYLYYFVQVYLDRIKDGVVTDEEVKRGILKNKSIQKMAKNKSSFDENVFVSSMGLSGVGARIDRITNYLTTEINTVLAYTFDTSKSINDVYVDLRVLVKEHEKQWEGWAEVDEDEGDKIIKYYKEQRLAWFNLNRAYCSKEQEAMGHCGNQPRSHTDDVIYSLSIIKKRHDGVWFREPHVTAVLEDDGLWGEIKGRSNNKPHQKYGEYIKDLMLIPESEGMKGARWEPEGNWNWDDFTDDQKEEILAAKPNFQQGHPPSISQSWIEGGDVDDSELYDELRRVHTDYISIKDVDNGEIVVDTNFSIDDLIDNDGDEVRDKILEVCREIEYIYPEGVDEDEAEDDHDIRVELIHEMIMGGLSRDDSDTAYTDIFEEEIDRVDIYDPLTRFRYTLEKLMNTYETFASELRKHYAEILDQEEFSFISDDQKSLRIANAIYKNLKLKGIELDNNYIYEKVYDECISKIARKIVRQHTGLVDEDLDSAPVGRANFIIRYSNLDVDDYYIEEVLRDGEEYGLSYADAVMQSIDRDYTDIVRNDYYNYEFDVEDVRPLFNYFFDPENFEYSRSSLLAFGNDIIRKLKQNK